MINSSLLSMESIHTTTDTCLFSRSLGQLFVCWSHLIQSVNKGSECEKKNPQQKITERRRKRIYFAWEAFVAGNDKETKTCRPKWDWDTSIDVAFFSRKKTLKKIWDFTRTKQKIRSHRWVSSAAKKNQKVVLLCEWKKNPEFLAF